MLHRIKNYYLLLFLSLLIVVSSSIAFIFFSSPAIGSEDCCHHECNLTDPRQCQANAVYECQTDCDADAYRDWCLADDCSINGQTCVDGVCQTSGPSCTEELVDDNQDGTFNQCGCTMCNGCLCDTDNDNNPDGVCLESECNTTFPISFNCGIDGCDFSDNRSPISTNIVQTWACDSSLNLFTNNYFTQDGLGIFSSSMIYECADTNSYGHIAECAGYGGEFRQYLPDGCANTWECPEGALCDDTLDNGDFNPTKTCSSGVCDGSISDELVDANFDGNCEFKAGGCNSDCNGCLCSIDGDADPDGVCVDEDCIVTAPVVLDCGDICNTSDISSPAFVNCEGNEGKACSFLNIIMSGSTDLSGVQYFPQTSICGENMMSGSPSQCFYPGDHTCKHDSKYYSRCSMCSDGDPCDDNLGGNFDSEYGVCSAGVCNPNNCTKEKVDFAENGNFTLCGCSSSGLANTNGFVCDINGDLIGDGLCVEDECVTAGDISMDCFYQECIANPYLNIYKGCGRDGRSCDNDYVSSGQTFFEQDGICAESSGINACVSSGHVCKDISGAIFDSCNDCSDGDLCNILPIVGDISFEYGACNAGVCQQSVLPSSFDWRSHNGENWMTPIKNQGHCGGCWAFATAGMVEAKYNIQENNPDLDIDLSEQYLISDCCTSGSCTGGNITACSLTDETCYPYQTSDSSCSDRCDDWSNRLWNHSLSSVSFGTDHVRAQKIAIMSQGPLGAKMNSDYVWNNTSGYYTCSSTDINHAVVLIGWDDVGEYWIIRNSWGLEWGDGGYGKIKYDACNLIGSIYSTEVSTP